MSIQIYDRALVAGVREVLGKRPLERRGPLCNIVAFQHELELRPAVALQVFNNQPVAPDGHDGRRGEPIQTSQLAAGLRALCALALQHPDDRAAQHEVAPLPRGDEALRPRRRGELVKKPREIGLRRAPGARRKF